MTGICIRHARVVVASLSFPKPAYVVVSPAGTVFFLNRSAFYSRQEYAIIRLHWTVSPVVSCNEHTTISSMGLARAGKNLMTSWFWTNILQSGFQSSL